MRRARGTTMALYALFIVFVCVPLLGYTADVGRLRAKQAQLATATQGKDPSILCLLRPDLL